MGIVGADPVFGFRSSRFRFPTAWPTDRKCVSPHASVCEPSHAATIATESREPGSTAPEPRARSRLLPHFVLPGGIVLKCPSGALNMICPPAGIGLHGCESDSAERCEGRR